MEERSVGLSCFLFLLFGFVCSLPAREERSQTLWRTDKVRDTRVDDVIKDIKQLVEAEYLTLMGEDRGREKLEKRRGEPAPVLRFIPARTTTKCFLECFLFSEGFKNVAPSLAKLFEGFLCSVNLCMKTIRKL